jgi:hypothetical protein
MIWADRLALGWAVVLILIICALQQPGGFDNSLAADNISGGWGALVLKLVVIPWGALRIIDAIFIARRSY